MFATLCFLSLSLVPLDSPSPSDPLFVVVGLDGKSVRGRIRGFGPKGDLRLVASDGTEFTRPIESVYKVGRADPTVVPIRPEGGVIVFPDGDILYRASVGKMTEAGIQLNSLAFGALTLPTDACLGMILNPPSDLDRWDSLIRRARTEPRIGEVAWLSNGDRQSGGLLGVEETVIAMQINGKRLNLDRPGVLAVGFDPTVVSYPRPKAAYWELCLTDGSRLGVTLPRIEQGQLVADTRFGVPIRVSQAEIFRLTASDEAIVWLSDREASRVQYKPYVGPVRPYARNQTVDGAMMRMGGQPFDRGIGTQSQTLLAYRLNPGDRRFQASVGVDDRGGALGSVKFRVWLDRTAVVTSELMAAGDPPLQIDVELGDAKVLILETDFGARGNVRDIADWADARLIRELGTGPTE